jgi:hypothetical protein
MELLEILNEISLANINRKQRSITKLFPSFHDRVEAVADKGGVRLRKLEPKVWRFKVHSGTKNNKWYSLNFQIKDIDSLITKHVSNKKLWTKSGEHVDLRKVARAIFFDADVNVSCSCPASQYWGPNYQLTQADAKYGRQERRPPDIRNPHRYGTACKHLQALLYVLPFYISTVAKWLKDNYSGLIASLEKTKGVSGRPKPKGAQRDSSKGSVAPTRPARPQGTAKKVEKGPVLLDDEEPTEEVEKEPLETELEEPEAKLSPKSRRLRDKEVEEPESDKAVEQTSEEEEEKKKLSPKARRFKDEEEFEEDVQESVTHKNTVRYNYTHRPENSKARDTQRALLRRF